MFARSFFQSPIKLYSLNKHKYFAIAGYRHADPGPVAGGGGRLLDGDALCGRRRDADQLLGLRPDPHLLCGRRRTVAAALGAPRNGPPH